MDAKKLMDDIAGLNGANDALRELLANAERELALVKVALKYAIDDIPHTCQFCMSNRCPNVERKCEGCENGSHWHWYGLMRI